MATMRDQKTELFEAREPLDGLDSPIVEGEHGEAMKPGTGQDSYDMHRMGKLQQLSRNFHHFSILGLTTVVMSTWIAMLASSTFSLIDGGRAGTIWVYIGSWVFMTCSVASMAEMASMAPTSGGQYHWVSEFSPSSVQKPLSYISGWLAALGWQGFIAVSAFQAGELILILANITHPSYEVQPYQGTLMTIGIGLLVTLANTYGARHLPILEGIILVLFVLGYFGIMIPLWVLGPIAPASEVFGSFANYGGWSSVGAACVIGQVAGGGSLLGADAAAHMSEEVKDASLTVPRMMMATIFLNGALGFVMTVTYVFVIQDVEKQILESEAVYPFVDIFATATGSEGGAIGMTVILVVLGIFADINAMAAASRQAWSFARDDGLPFPKWLGKIIVVNKTPLPVNAMFASLIICVIIALLNLGGSEVFDSIFGLTTGAVCLTYCLSIGSVLYRRLFGEPLPPARWSLGKSGVVINIIAMLYQIQLIVISFFPLFAKVDAESMNWGIAMFGGVAILCMVYYVIRARKTYKGPVVYINRD